jgi:hypothetical protein
MTDKTQTPPAAPTVAQNAADSTSGPGDNPLTTLATLAGEMVEAGEAAALGLFQAELSAMSALLGPTPPQDPAAKEAAARKDEAEIEAGFDNLPI